MKKKTLKVIKKRVKSKIKKKVVKLTRRSKKGAIKRSTKKRVYKRKKKATMEDIYKVINKVQLGSKPITFTVVNLEADTVENVVKDSVVRYHKIPMKTQTVFTLYPENKERSFEILDVEQLDDEIVEEGQIFP